MRAKYSDTTEGVREPQDMTQTPKTPSKTFRFSEKRKSVEKTNIKALGKVVAFSVFGG